MKYAALIFGDDERQPKAASNKLSSPEPGQVVRGIDGSVYRVASKIAGPDGYAVKLANLQGQPVQTPKNFRPVGTATMRFASWLKYHLAYNRDFDLYVNSYIERHNENVAKYNKDIERHNSTISNPKNQIPLEEPLPYPVGHDGKAFRWANWFQKVVSPKLYVPGHGDFEDKQVVKDELIHEMLFTVLGHRDVLSQFAAKAKSLGVNKENAASKLTNFLIMTFMYRIDEMRNKLKELNPEIEEEDLFYGKLSLADLREQLKKTKDPSKRKEIKEQIEQLSQYEGSPREYSMHQPSEIDESRGEINILDQEQYGIGGSEFQSVEAHRDIAKFREGFRKWLTKTQGQKAADNFILLFDIFWRILQEEEDAEIKRGDFQEEWLEKTGLSFGSFKEYFSRLPDLIEQFIMSHNNELGDKNIFVDLMNIIRAERTKRERGEQRQKKQRQPAMASLHLAAAEGDEKFTCMKCHRTSNASDSNNLQCPHCGGNMKTAEYTQEDWERDEAAQYDLERIEEAKHWEGEDEDDGKTASTGLNCWFFEWQPGKWYYLLENWNSPKGAWDWREHSDAYGPFSSKEAAVEHLDKNHANPGGWSTAKHDPKMAKDEVLKKLVAEAHAPTPPRRSRWGSAKPRTYSKTAETVETQHGAMTYEAGDVVNPDEYIPKGEFNPHNIRPWLIHNEFGTLAIVYAGNEQDALDEAADADKLDSVLVTPECILTGQPGEDPDDCTTHEHEDWEAAYLGNAGEPFDLTYIGLISLPNQQYGVPEVATDEMLQGYEKEITEENDKKFLKDMGIQGSRKIAQKLLRGDQLTPDMVKQVKDAFIYRWTVDNKRRGEVYHCDKCDVQQNPYVNETSAEGHQHPTIPLQTDDQWLKEHAFYFTNAGRLQPRRHAVPAYLAPEPEPTVASVANKFAMEKAAYNPGKGEYIYQADVYCEACGDALKRRLDKQGLAPTDPSDESSWDSDKYPKGPYYNQEADGPEHCARCGEFLENPLTTAGYQYLNQMILEHEADGKGQSDIIDEWKAFYPEREQEGYIPSGVVDAGLGQVEQDTDKRFLSDMGIRGAKKAAISNRGWFEVTHNSNDFQCPHCGAGLTDEEWNTEGGDKLSGDYEVECPDCGKPFIVDIAVETRYHTQPKKAANKKAMIPHEFNNADGQAIRPETNPMSTDYVEGEADTTEFRQPRMGADKWEPTVGVGQTIYQQLGGNRFKVMTGAKNFFAGPKDLTFRLPGAGGFAKDGINAVQITLDANDTYTVTFSRIRGGNVKVISMHRDVYAENLREVFENATGLRTSLGTMGKSSAVEQWKCMDCGNIGQLNREGNCEACDSQAVHPETPAVQRPALPIEPTDPSTFRETKPVDVEKRMVPIRQRNIRPNPNPRLGADKTAQGAGNTTVTMQDQNVTTPSTPGKGQPLAVPDAIDQVPGPHSPNAPATAPRSPGIQPRVVNVPAGTEGDDAMSIPQTASARDPEEIICPKCGSDNVDIDADEEGYKIYCEDCEQTTHGRLKPGRPARDYRETPGDELSMLERLGEPEGELGEPEPDVDAMYEADRLDRFDKGAAGEDDIYRELEEEGRQDKELSEQMDASNESERVYALPQDQKEAWLIEHGWVKDDEWHGATWWMQKPMWTKTDHEEDIPYQDTDDAIEKELELLEAEEFPHVAAGCSSGKASYTDEDAALWAIEAQNGKRQKQGLAPVKLYVYKCPECGSLHLTSNSQKLPSVKNPAPPPSEEQQWREETDRLGFKGAAGSNSGDDDARGVGDLYRENFYEHRTEGLSSEGMLSGMKDAAVGNPAFEELDGVWTSPDQAPTDEEIEILGNYLAQSGTATSVPSGVMLAKKWRQERWAVSGDEDRDLLKSMGIQAASENADQERERLDAEFRGMFDYMDSLGWLGRNPWYPEKYPWLSINVYSDGWIARNDLVKEQLGEGTGVEDLKKFLSKYDLNKLRTGYQEPEEELEFNKEDKSLLKDMGIKAAVAPAPAPVVSPNVVQNQSLMQEEAQMQAPGTSVAIIPGEGQGEEDPGTLKRHTIEPELPNARYHMMGQLAAEEEDRLLREDPEYSQWADMLSQSGEVDPEAAANPDMFTEEERAKWKGHEPLGSDYTA